MRITKHIFISLFLISGFFVWGQGEHVHHSLKDVAQQFLQQIDKSPAFSINKTEQFNIDNSNNASAYVFHLLPQGFVMVSSRNQEVLAFSFENNLEQETIKETAITKDLLKAVVLINQEKKPKDYRDISDETYGPFVENLWGQVNCTDQSGATINVTNLFTPNNYAAGCVAISQASILKHYNWPLQGVGSHSYTDSYGSSTGSYEVNFAATNYSLEASLNRYRGKTSTIPEREIAGQIAFHSAVSLNMDFEYNGSTSNVNKIPSALASHFRFTSVYRKRSSNSFWPLIDSNMVWGKPAILSVKASNGAGHAVVCDGVMIQNGDYFYHLNMGWWGTTNGWYKIKGSFNAGGYNYVTGGVMNILPTPMIETPRVWNDAESDTLCWYYPAKAEAQAFEVQQNKNDEGWETISNTITDTFLIIYPETAQTYQYRLRAKTNNRWYYDSWGEEATLIWSYNAVDDEYMNEISIYPSPFNHQLHVECQVSSFSRYPIRIYNQLGMLVFEKPSLPEDRLIIDTQTWKPGLYLVRMTDGTQTKTYKLIKR